MSLINEFSIQLYTIRDIIKDDYAGSLRKLAEIGYTGVEFAGEFGGYDAKGLKALLDDCGLKPVGAHVGLELLREDIDRQIDFHAQLGTEYIIAPSSQMSSRENTLALADEFTRFSEKVRAAGMKFGYHNHDFEFKQDGGEYLYDILFNNTAPDAVLAEIDLYWIAFVGLDPVEYVKKLGKRAELLHLKQIAADGSKKQADLGDGAIDFAAVIRAGKEVGVKHYIFEQEEYAVDPMTSAVNGFKHVMSL